MLTIAGGIILAVVILNILSRLANPTPALGLPSMEELRQREEWRRINGG